jgi:Flp pilus assembly protein TadD
MTNLKMKRYLRAIDDANAVIQMEPENFKAHIRKATACKESNRGEEGIAAVTKALELKPKSKEVQCLALFSCLHDACTRVEPSVAKVCIVLT